MKPPVAVAAAVPSVEDGAGGTKKPLGALAGGAVPPAMLSRGEGLVPGGTSVELALRPASARSDVDEDTDRLFCST